MDGKRRIFNQYYYYSFRFICQRRYAGHLQTLQKNYLVQLNLRFRSACNDASECLKRCTHKSMKCHQMHFIK